MRSRYHHNATHSLFTGEQGLGNHLECQLWIILYNICNLDFALLLCRVGNSRSFSIAVTLENLEKSLKHILAVDLCTASRWLMLADV